MIGNRQKIVIIGPEGTDINLLISFLLLNLLSWVTLYNISGTFTTDLDNPLTRQIVFSFIGILVFFIISYFSIESINSLTPFIFIICIGLLSVVLLTEPSFGVRRWFRFGVIDFQPSELAKVSNVLMVCYILSRENLSRYYSLIPPILSVILIYRQPDFGTVLIILTSYFILMYISGISTPIIFTAIFSGVCTLFLLIEYNLLKSWQIDRITQFFSQESLGDFSQQQSRLAISSGGLIGRAEEHLINYGEIFVPVKTTDFIFSSFAENFGFIGVVILFMIWIQIFYRSAKIVQSIEEVYSKFLLVGLVSLLIVQLFINLGTVIGYLPVTGLPFPMLSLGGSSIAMNAVVFGILNRIFIENRVYI